MNKIILSIAIFLLFSTYSYADLTNKETAIQVGSRTDAMPSTSSYCGSNTSVYLEFEGPNGSASTTDPNCNGSGAKTVTFEGSAALTTAWAGIGMSSLNFTGNTTSDRVKLADSANWHPGSGDFLIRVNINPANTSSRMAIFSQYQSSGSDNTGQYLVANETNGGDVCIEQITNSVDQLYACTAGGVLTANTRNEVVFQRSGSNCNFWVNGQPKTTTVLSGSCGATLTNYTGDLYIGLRRISNGSLDLPFNGYIDSFGYYLTALYSPNQPYTLPQTKFSTSSVGSSFYSFLSNNAEYGAIGIDNTDGNKLKIGVPVFGSRSITFDSNGNMGVGTSAPVNKLDVAGNVSIGTYAGVSSAPSNGLIVSGNVGVGTVNPGQAVDVTGTVRFSGSLLGTSTTNIGWSRQTAANQACNTTCTTACVGGFDQAGPSLVDCADATADQCWCAGAN